MATPGKPKQHVDLMPGETMIEVVATKGDYVIKVTLPWSEVKKIKKVTGWIYRNYQPGVCTLKENKPKK